MLQVPRLHSELLRYAAYLSTNQEQLLLPSQRDRLIDINLPLALHSAAYRFQSLNYHALLSTLSQNDYI